MEGRSGLLASFVVLVLIGHAVQAGPAELRRTWRSDAALHDVQLVSRNEAWAVGDHGAAWKTADGGKTWTLLDTGVDATLRSVCLLTDEVGWVAGWQVHGSAELAQGVLLATRDGGKTWQPLNTKSLSPLRYVRFFGLSEGLVIGEPTLESPTGAWATTDGGQSWTPLAGQPSRGWTSAALISPELGVVADRHGGVSLLAGPQLLPSKLPALKGRTLRGIALSSEHRAWLVGDGGLALTSKSGGVVWELPAGPLPDDLRQVSDFHAVAAHDDAVWIAGNPGGVIWHSRDGGKRWIKQATGVTTPINKIHFVNATHGCAVGELGVILVTNNGGETWTATQGRNRHAALLSIHNRVGSLSPELVTKLSGEQGYRSAAWIAIRPAETSGPLGIADRISDAVTTSGGSSGSAAWPLPLDVPGLELNSEKLLENWNRTTEGQLPQMLLGRIVRQIRVWRPLVVIVDQPAPEDAAGQLIFDATLRAVEQAGDGTRYVVQREFGGLAPWKVERVYLQLLPGSTGEVSLDPFEFLPRWQTSLRLASAPSRGLLSFDASLIKRPNFRAVNQEGKPSPQSRGTDFFTGLSMAMSNDVRRDLPPIDDRQLDQQIKSVQRHRNVISHAEKSFDDPRVAGQMIAQLRDVTAGMTAEQAAQTLYELFDEFRRRGQLDLAEQAGQELLRNHPEQPVAADVARWLLTCLASEEVAWRKIRQLTDQRRTPREASSAAGALPIKQIAFPANKTHLPELKERLKKGQQAVQYLESRWPNLAQSPEIQFPLAVLHRSRGSQNAADAVYRKWMTRDGEQSPGDWSGAVRREIWLAQLSDEVPDGIAACRRTESKPQLDGLLSDECWEDADEWRLAFRSPASMPDVPPPIAMLAYDDQFLYLAASVARIDGQSADPPHTAGRTHDADLRRHDRLTFLLDTDRDYHTWYAFHVDQRGMTAESCWEDAAWNPQWFVAIDGDTSHWRVEIAIPWSELAAKRPEPGAAWAIGLERTAPAVGQQTWMPPSATKHPGASFGLLRFE